MKQKIVGLQFIVNTDPPPSHSFLEVASKSLLGGADSIQFRHKGVYSREIYSIVCQLAELCARFSIPLIVNDRVDIALSIPLAGLHIGQTDLPVKEARKLLGEDRIIGCTAANVEQAKQAERDGADYIGCGHIYATKTKMFATPPIGLAVLEDVCKNVTIPVIAIGGIKEHNIGDVCATGVSGVALISAIGSSPDPLGQTQKFKTMMDSYAKTT